MSIPERILPNTVKKTGEIQVGLVRGPETAQDGLVLDLYHSSSQELVGSKDPLALYCVEYSVAMFGYFSLH